MHEIIRTEQAFIWIVQDGSQASHRRAQVQWFDICQHLLNCYENEGYDFLRPIIVVNETWVHYHNPESMEWKPQQSPVKRKFKMQQQQAKRFCFGIHKGQ
jgi:hypothetical protein